MYKPTIAGSGTPIAAPSRGFSSAAKASTEAVSWYNRVARAWGAALDRQADRTVNLAQELNAGNDSPGVALQVAAAAHQLSFLSTAASTASNSIGQALEALGRKQ